LISVADFLKTLPATTIDPLLSGFGPDGPEGTDMPESTGLLEDELSAVLDLIDGDPSRTPFKALIPAVDQAGLPEGSDLRKQVMAFAARYLSVHA